LLQGHVRRARRRGKGEKEGIGEESKEEREITHPLVWAA